ncbi:hypothetical protein SSX86_013873 [Deinandra increscens subsp. villosa]|uniref:Dof-type domain-containing protein n=1 Tax=Deinandra increscens subsp. villosa TaxID=3103831 RepID=A0AAP0D0U0_9ASTR
MWHPPPSPFLYHHIISFFLLIFHSISFLTRRRQPPPVTMSDPGIILFGQKIVLPETPTPPPSSAAAAAAEKPCSSSHDQRNDESEEGPKTPSIEEDIMSENVQSTDGETVNLQPRILKKPDKILPCPRCDSMNTKFCYFNNSNVNQPRHFCKSCQRYWTAGGTMRNMPVGAGRRKKKAPPSHYFESSSALAAANHIEFAPDHSPKVVSFGQNPPHLEANSVVENMEFNSHSQVHWIPYNPWNTPIPVPVSVPVPIPISPICPSPYWGSVSWLPPPSGSILGKHSTELNGSNEELKKRKSSTILIPKTLRIDDPDEAAKSSIWATLGIKNENSSRGDLFKGFESKGNEKKKTMNTEPPPSLALQANPAAFSRSLCFQESV